MAKRVAVVLSGCGAGDGSEIREAVLSLLTLDRAGAQAVCAAPDVPQPPTFDHLRGTPAVPAAARNALVEAARIARGTIVNLTELKIDQVDALIFPGGMGVGSALSNYSDKGQLCEVNPAVARLLKEALASHRPLGFIGLAAILGARVLGPVAGVRVTLGPRGTGPAKHAAVMGADVRPCNPNDIYFDKKNRVISTPAYMYEDIRLAEAAQGIEKLVRTVLQLARDRNPAPRPQATGPAGTPRPGGPGNNPGRATPARGSV